LVLIADLVVPSSGPPRFEYSTSHRKPSACRGLFLASMNLGKATPKATCFEGAAFHAIMKCHLPNRRRYSRSGTPYDAPALASSPLRLGDLVMEQDKKETRYRGLEERLEQKKPALTRGVQAAGQPPRPRQRARVARGRRERERKGPLILVVDASLRRSRGVAP
jgi:hypothetical protein